jgi:protocatechuate 3,4-dioxygenase beta subunit
MKKALLTLALLLAGSSLDASPIPIGGQVLDSDGKPVAGAKAILLPHIPLFERQKLSLAARMEPDPAATAATDAGGRFRVEAPEAGMWRVRVEAQGFAPRQFELVPLLEAVELPAARLLRDRGFQVTVLDKEGRPVPGARVGVTPAQPSTELWEDRRPLWEPVIALGAPGVDGRVTLPWGSEGQRRVRAVAPGFLEIAAEGSPRLEKGCARTVEISDHRGRPAPGVLVESVGWALAVSGEDGRATAAGPCGKEARWYVRAADGRSAEVLLPAPPKESKPPAVRVALPPPSPPLLGRVVAADTREPIPGAVVWNGALKPAYNLIFTRADARGVYTFNLPSERASLGLNAAAPGYLPGGEAVHPGEGPSFALRPAATIGGTVVDAQGRPVPGALLRPSPVRAHPAFFRGMTTLSDANGRFRLSLPPETAFEIDATHERFAPAWVQIPPVAPRAARTDVRIVFQEGVTGFGRVVDSRERPVAGARVALRPVESDREGVSEFFFDDPQEFRATTDAQGLFSIDRLPPGTFNLAVAAQGFAPMTVPGIDIAGAGRPAGRVDLGTVVLPPGVEVRGIVVDPEGKPVEGAMVELQSESFGIASWVGGDSADSSVQTTGADGRFGFSSLRSGDRVGLSVRKQGFLQSAPHTVETPTDEPVRIVLQRGARVAGRVIDERGNPVQGAWLMLSTRTGGFGDVPSGDAMADDQGRFEFAAVQPGKLTLTANADGYLQEEVEVEIPARGLENLRVSLRPGASIVGRVLGPDGGPVPGAQVQLVPDDAGNVIALQPGQTDGSGSFRLRGVPEGPRSLVVEHPAHPRTVKDLEVRPGENRIEIQLGAGHEVRGRVVDSAGRPVSGAWVRLDAASYSRSPSEAGTGEDGAFRFPAVPPGDYGIAAGKQGYAEAHSPERVRVVDGPVEGLVLRLESGGVIRGQVRGVAPEDFGRSQVIAARDADGAERTGRLDYEGRYRIEGLGAGEWTVALFSPQGIAHGRTELAGEGAEAVLDLEVKPGANLTGRVLSSGEPVAGANVLAQGTEQAGMGFDSTDAQGRFELRGLAPGVYSVTVFDFAKGQRTTQTVTLEADREIVLELAAQRVSGRVVDAADAAPVAGATVRTESLGGTSGPDLGFPQGSVTGTDGTFTIEGLSEGTFRVTARKDGYAPAEATVAVPAGGSVDDVRLALEPAAGLVLEVLAPTGLPPERVEVALLDAAGRALVADGFTPGEGGRVRVTSAPAGRFRMLVASPGAATAALDVTVPGAPIRLALLPGARLDVSVPALADTGAFGTFSVMGADGQPFRGVNIGSVLQEWPLWQGAGAIDGLPPGAWRVRAVAPDGRAWEGTVTLPAGGRGRAVLE